jgi:hypothetical protein
MSKGLLAKTTPAANTDTKLYEIPSTVEYVTASLRIVNTTAEARIVDVAVGSSDSLLTTDKIVPSMSVPPNSIMDVACELYSPGEKFIIRANGTGVNFRLTGLTEGGA